MKQYIIWKSSQDFDDWKENLRAEYPESSDEELMRLMDETNSEYLMDEKANLGGISIPNGILVVADLGLWNGRRNGILKQAEITEVKDCLRGFVNGDSDLTIYVDNKGELRSDEAHHDGTNHYLFRAFKPNVTQEQKDALYELIYYQHEYESRMRRLTYRLGDLIGDVYGWKFNHRPKYSLSTN